MEDITEFTEYLTNEELEKIAPMIDRLTLLEDRKKREENFLEFVKFVWPQFIQGNHHKIYAQKLQDVADGKINRLIIYMHRAGRIKSNSIR